MYVIPYFMGPVGSPFSKIGVEITDSPYVVANMRIMTRMGEPALTQLGGSGDFVKGLHSLGDLSPDRRFILHFPEEQGDLERRLRLRRQRPARQEVLRPAHRQRAGARAGLAGRAHADPRHREPGGRDALRRRRRSRAPAARPTWRCWCRRRSRRAGRSGPSATTSAWMRPGPDGRLWAINPEAGFFGVAPGHVDEDQPQRHGDGAQELDLHQRRRDRGQLPVVGRHRRRGAGAADRLARQAVGRRARPRRRRIRTRASPRRRSQCPCISPQFDDPQGVPISAIIFGGRRARTAPLVFEAFDWNHGVFVGASVASETTAAATGAVGVVRRDPMAMLPFCGYNMGDYFGHWLQHGRRASSNRRRSSTSTGSARTPTGKFIWPGFGENMRALRWIVERCEGQGRRRRVADRLPARQGRHRHRADSTSAPRPWRSC